MTDTLATLTPAALAAYRADAVAAGNAPVVAACDRIAPAPAAFTLGADGTGRVVIVRGPAPFTAAEGPTGILDPASVAILAALNLTDDPAAAPAEVATVESLIARSGAHAFIVRRTPRGSAPAVITEHLDAAAAMSAALMSHGWGPLAATPDGAEYVAADAAYRESIDPLNY